MDLTLCILVLVGLHCCECYIEKNKYDTFAQQYFSPETMNQHHVRGQGNFQGQDARKNYLWAKEAYLTPEKEFMIGDFSRSRSKRQVVGTGCRAILPWTMVPGMDNWCVINCNGNFCPPSHCICDNMPAVVIDPQEQQQQQMQQPQQQKMQQPQQQQMQQPQQQQMQQPQQQQMQQPQQQMQQPQQQQMQQPQQQQQQYQQPQPT